jgi:ribonuclease HI
VNKWRKAWEARGFLTASKQPVKNADLWRALYVLVDSHPGIRFEWVKGHASDPMNIEVDELAKVAAHACR